VIPSELSTIAGQQPEADVKQAKRVGCGLRTVDNQHRRVRFRCTRPTGQQQRNQEHCPLKFEEPFDAAGYCGYRPERLLVGFPPGGSAMMGGDSGYHFSRLACAPPALPGAAVQVTLADMGMTR
jgi:hypothetical protein